MGLSFEDTLHGGKVFFFSGFIAQPRISPGDLQIGVAQ
jgi:hypothetical protein